MFFHRRTVEYDVALLIRQLRKRHVRPHAHRAAHVRHQRPHERAPRRDRAVVDRKTLVRHERCKVHGAHHARPVAAAARALRVERQFLGAGGKKCLPAHGAAQRLSHRHVCRRRNIVPVRAAVLRQTREHEPQAVQQLRPRAECAADARHARTLMQRQRRWDIQRLIHLRARRLRHPPPRVGGQRIQIPP